MEASPKLKGRGSDPFAGPAGPALMEAVSDLQMPGLEVSFSTPGHEGATIADPLVLLAGLCVVAEESDPGTEPWPHEDGEPVEFVRSEVAEKIGLALIEGIFRLAPMAQFRIHYLFRNMDNWKKAGRTVLGEMKRPAGLLKEYAAADYIVVLNWPVWVVMNPMQRVALVYHELRHGDVEGKVRAHDFEGFFDELKLFGTDTYRDWQSLAEAAGRGESVHHQFSLELEL